MSKSLQGAGLQTPRHQWDWRSISGMVRSCCRYGVLQPCNTLYLLQHVLCCLWSIYFVVVKTVGSWRSLDQQFTQPLRHTLSHTLRALLIFAVTQCVTAAICFAISIRVTVCATAATATM